MENMVMIKREDGFIEVDHKLYMDGRHVAEVLNKKFKHLIRDIKVIVQAIQHIDNVGDNNFSTRRLQDLSDSIDIFSYDGVIVTKRSQNGGVAEILIGEEMCDFLRLYSDFRYSIILYREWKKVKANAHLLLTYQRASQIRIEDMKGYIDGMRECEKYLEAGEAMNAQNALGLAESCSKRAASIASKGLNARKHQIKAIAMLNDGVERIGDLHFEF